MKRIILIIFCMFSTTTYGQDRPAVDIDKYDNLDSVRLKFTYKLSFVEDIGKPDVLSTDMQILEIGDHLSKYYSKYLIDYSEYVKIWQDKNNRRDVIPKNPEKGSQPYEIYKDHPKKGIQTITDISDIAFSVFLFTYEEPVPAFNWLMNYEFSTILGYRCQKATASFRGRKYTAWFTTDIPVSNGPWKFGGLPGLIMKVTDSEGHYDFECVGIEQPHGDIIKFFKGKYDKISRKDYLKLYHRYYNDLVGFHESFGSRISMATSNGSKLLKPGEYPPSPYNPIERE